MASGGFDDRDGTIWFDGKLVPWRDANIHVLTHAMHYASAVFEGQRAYNGTIYALSDLVRSAGPLVVLVIMAVIMGRPRS